VGKLKTAIQQGECIYIKRNSSIRITEIPDNDRPYKAICMNFPVRYLQLFFGNMPQAKNLIHIIKLLTQNNIKLPPTPCISSLFIGMFPYFESGFIPCDEIVDLKLKQGMYSMLYVIQNYYKLMIENLTIDLN